MTEVTARLAEGDGDAVARLAGRNIGTIVYCLEIGLGVSECVMRGVRAMTDAGQFIGRACTVRLVPVRRDVAEARRKAGTQDPQRLAIDEIGKGEVLVVDARGEMDAAILGDIYATRVKTAGGVSVVTDGCVRDLPGLRALNFPVFARGSHASTSRKRHLGADVNQPIACGGVLVMPGDLIVGDEEGVAVVPRALEDEVAKLVEEQDRLDSFVQSKVAAGERLDRAFPPNAAIRAEYERQRDADAP